MLTTGAEVPGWVAVDDLFAAAACHVVFEVDLLPIIRIRHGACAGPLYEVHPAAVVAVFIGIAILDVAPFERMDAGAYGVRLLRPVDLSADAVLAYIVDIELEIVTVLFGRDLPVELERLGAIGFYDRLQDGFLVVAQGIVAASRVVLIVVVAAVLRDPGPDVAIASAGGEPQVRIQRLCAKSPVDYHQKNAWRR